MRWRIAAIIVILLLGVGLLLASRAEAEPTWVTQYADSYCGLVTSSGEVMDCQDFTAASSYLPFGSVVRVSYAGQQVDVRITDTCGCPLDLSPIAASVIGLPGADVADVIVL